jgi:hypothetical protein
MGWKMLLSLVLPLIEAAGQAKIDEDANDTGKDDAIGVAMIYGVKLFRAIANGKELPKAPKELS